MNAVVYARFSSHRQGEQSIEGQVEEAERFAAAHGLTIVKVYADRAQTGRNDYRNRKRVERPRSSHEKGKSLYQEQPAPDDEEQEVHRHL